MKISYKKKLILFVFLLCAGALGYWFISKNNQKYRYKERYYKLPQNSTLYRNCDVYIRDFHFTHLDAKNILYSVDANSFGICPAKFGPFAISMLKVVRMENVKLNIYYKSKEKQISFNIVNFILKNDFSDKLKKIKGIYIKNIIVKIHKNDKLLCCISSKEVRVDPLTGNVIFKGEAKIISQGKILEANVLKWLCRKYRFKTDGKYKFITNKGIIEGTKLEFDPLLNRIKFKGGKLWVKKAG